MDSLTDSSRAERPIRVAASMPQWFAGRRVGNRPYQPTKLPRLERLADARALLSEGGFDLIVFNNTPRELWLCCLARALNGGRGPTLVCADLLLQVPYGWRAKLKATVFAWLLRQVSRFIFFHKDTEPIERLFGVPADRIRYVPFKVNDLPVIQRTSPRDDDYILSCGRSKRDYATLAKAVDGLDVQVRILVNPREATEEHGSILDASTLPANVQVVTDDGSPGSWIDWISRCSFMAIPLRADSLHPSGVSAYVVAMALGKCVVITDGVATRKLLDGGEAVIVPPHDAAALRAAIQRVQRDPAYRAEVAARGRRYALALGDEHRLADDIARSVGELVGP
jgi:glycosyltransferase involved in cell wall biosynthesis